MRAGKRDPGDELVRVAVSLRQAGRFDEAERYFQDAIRRDPRSWMAYKEAAEFYRHPPKLNMGEALRLYEQASTVRRS
jgi:tetratricopeptide (TPR) repeat protein